MGLCSRHGVGELRSPRRLRELALGVEELVADSLPRLLHVVPVPHTPMCTHPRYPQHTRVASGWAVATRKSTTFLSLVQHDDHALNGSRSHPAHDQRSHPAHDQRPQRRLSPSPTCCVRLHRLHALQEEGGRLLAWAHDGGKRGTLSMSMCASVCYDEAVVAAEGFG